MTKLILLNQKELPQSLIEKLLGIYAVENIKSYSSTCREIHFSHSLSNEEKKMIQDLCFVEQTDTIFLKDTFNPQDIKLLVFDMDSTLINIECIDEIARQCGKEKEVSKITEASMRGEITDFAQGLIERVKLLKGASENDLETVYTKRLQLNPGAKNLILGAQQRGWNTLLVSGGFTYFTERIKQLLSINEAYSNTLDIQHGLLTGKVLGPIVDGVAKAQFVRNSCLKLGIAPSASIVMGDGSNDLLMMEIAGLSIGYQPKPIVKEKADGTFQFVGLDAVLELFIKK
jgi:phosphoserine phosphatase